MKMMLARWCAHRELTDQRPRASDTLAEILMAGGINLIDTSGQDGHSAPPYRERGLVCRPVDTQRQATHHHLSQAHGLGRKGPCCTFAVKRWLACTNYRQ
jgi:hypothetical protein